MRKREGEGTNSTARQRGPAVLISPRRNIQSRPWVPGFYYTDNTHQVVINICWVWNHFLSGRNRILEEA